MCPYCQRPALLVDSDRIYPDVPVFGKFWQCRPCEAWVGTHKGSKRFAPLGRLANAPLRAAKADAHEAFDRLWQGRMRDKRCTKAKARGAASAWLAQRLGFPSKSIHLGFLDVDDCRRVVEICRSVPSPQSAPALATQE